MASMETGTSSAGLADSHEATPGQTGNETEDQDPFDTQSSHAGPLN